MGKALDLTGQRFGKLVVIAQHPDRQNGHIQWRCQCDCGSAPLLVKGVRLTSGQMSCGCLALERGIARLGDLTGRRYGRLVVLGPVQGQQRGLRQWRCRCDCGAQCSALGTRLVRSLKRSCGCLLQESLVGRPPKKVALYGTDIAVATVADVAGVAYATAAKELKTVSAEVVIGRARRTSSRRLLGVVTSPVTSQDLAHRLGMSPSALRRALRKLQRQGKVEVKDGVVKLVNGGT